MRYLPAIFLSVVFALPALAKDDPLSQVAEDLAKIAEKMKPVASVQQDGRNVSLSYNTRTFMVHSSDKLGHRSKKAHETIGPRYDGLIVHVTVQDGRYFGAAKIPQSLRRPYWTTFVNAYPISKGKQHLHVNISYGNRTDRNVIKQIKGLLESKVDDDPKVKAKKLRAHNKTIPAKQATPSDVLLRLKATSWRMNRKQFNSHLSNVKKGWSKGRLLQHAGEPKEKTVDSWYYKWIESRVFGGYYSFYTFKFQNGVVSEIQTGTGHVSKSPRKE